jgi:tetratricopeptide (TPR) repeat protein
LGVAYAELNDVRLAINYLEQAIAIQKINGDVNGVADNSYIIALHYAIQKNEKKAIPLAQAAAEFWHRAGNKDGEERALELLERLRKSR